MHQKRKANSKNYGPSNVISDRTEHGKNLNKLTIFVNRKL